MILISVQREEEISLARSFRRSPWRALGRASSCSRMPPWPSAIASAFVPAGMTGRCAFLNPDNFALLVVFSGARSPENLVNLRLIEAVQRDRHLDARAAASLPCSLPDRERATLRRRTQPG